LARRAVSNFFSIFASFTRFAVVMKSLIKLLENSETLKLWNLESLPYARNGIPKCFNSSRA
jgi:hypothetical protein